MCEKCRIILLNYLKDSMPYDIIIQIKITERYFNIDCGKEIEESICDCDIM